MRREPDQEPERRSEFDIRTHLRTLLAYRWLILLCTVGVGIAVTVWSLNQPRLYEATALIEYNPNPARPLGDDVEDVANPMGSFWTAREFFATQNRIIASRTVALRVVRNLGLHDDSSFASRAETEEETADHLLRQLSVEPVKDTRLVRLTVRDHSPERAKAIADGFSDAYIEKTMEDRMSSTVGALEWLGDQLDTLRQELETSELALHEFKEEHNVLSVSMEDRQNLVAQEIEAFSGALTEASERRITVAARVQRLRNALGDDALEASGTVFDTRSGLQALREQLRAKLAEREGLGSRYGAAHPSIRNIDAEILALRTQLSEEVDTIVRNAEADLREVRSVEGGLRSALDRANAAGLELNLREIEYQRLNRQRQNKAKLYEVVLQRTTETDLTRMLRTSHARIVDRAVVPEFPVYPNNTVNAIGGTLGGLLLGIVLAFGLRFLDRRLRTPEAVEELGITVLGVVPHIGQQSASSGAYAPKKRKRRLAAGASPDLFVHEHPMSTAAECCRTVRTNLMFMAVGADECKVFVVTSTNPREGKTTVAGNLAISIAQSGKRVLLVDTDLRRPRVHAAFGLGREVGVTSFIVGDRPVPDCILETKVPGLSVLPSGPVPPNPSELLLSPRFEALVAELRRRYDCVIFDSPPLGAVTDAAIIGPQVDGVLLVVHSGRTTRDALRSARRQLSDVGARILGAVLNDVEFGAQGYGSYYYRRYGEYYESESDEEVAEQAAE